MSTFLEHTRARVPRLADAGQQPTRLSVATGTDRRVPRLPFAAFVLAVAGAGLVGLLVLNTTLQQGAFHARSLEQRAESLVMRKDALALQVDALRAPERVAHRAQSMGMVLDHSPAFLFLGDGTVRGDAAAADPGAKLRLQPGLHPVDPATPRDGARTADRRGAP